MMMRAAVLSKGGVTVESVPAPVPATDDDALVRVLRAGVCNTDLELIDGYLDYKVRLLNSTQYTGGCGNPRKLWGAPQNQLFPFFFFARELTDSDGRTL